MIRDRFRAAWQRLQPFELDWIQVEVSARCQGRCRYCPVHRLSGKREPELMTPDTFRRLLPALSAAKLVYLQGWGEPLLHPDFWEMVRQVGRTGAGVGFTTNGALLGPANRRALLESPVEILAVSLAGAAAETHDRFRPGSPLAAVDRNLEALKREAVEAGSSPPNLHLAYLLMADNLDELPEAVALARHWGATQMVVSQLSLILDREMEDQSLLVRRDLWPRAREVVAEARKRARGAVGKGSEEEGSKEQDPGGLVFPRSTVEPSPETGMVLHVHGFHTREANPACTENVLRSCFISARGQVSPCVMTNLGLRAGTRATHRFQGRDLPIRSLEFGNLREASLEEIWRGKEARAFRRTFRHRIWQGTRGREGLPESCRECHKLFET
ncbi:MAG: radical SAM protein [Longimicrobiales bacterium]